MTKAVEQSSSPNTEIVIVREFLAPRDLVWDAWTQRDHVEQWFGPKGFTTRVEEMDFRVGGRSRYVMIGPDGTEYPGEAKYIEVDPKNKIVSSDEFGEDFIKNNPSADLPEGMILTALFDDLGERCRLTLTVSHPTEADRIKHEKMGVVAGWNSSLDKMEAYLAKVQG